MDGSSVGTFGFDAVPAAFGDDVAVCDARRRKILRADHLAHFAVVEVGGHAHNGLEEAGLACVGNVETESFVRFVDLRSPLLLPESFTTPPYPFGNLIFLPFVCKNLYYRVNHTHLFVKFLSNTQVTKKCFYLLYILRVEKTKV